MWRLGGIAMVVLAVAYKWPRRNSGSNKSLVMAYDIGVAALKQQNDNLGSLRNRSTGVLGVAALVTSFGGSLGFISHSQQVTFPRWAALSLLGVVISIGALTVAIQWPVHNWAYGLHPGLVLAESDKLGDEDRLRRDLVVKMVEAMRDNSATIYKRLRLYQAAVILLVVEVVSLAIVVR